MAAKVLHFGTDDCNRLLVLRSVGYDVEFCPSLVEFPPLLQRSDPDAVLVTGRPNRERGQVVTLTRELSHARLILFGSSHSVAGDGEFDLVIPPLMHPEEWLQQVSSVIERSRTLTATATVIREQSVLLRKDSEIARLKSMIERERSATARARTQRVLDDIRQEPDPSEK